MTTVAFTPLLVAPSAKAAGATEVLGVDFTLASLVLLLTVTAARIVGANGIAYRSLLVLAPLALVATLGMLRVPLEQVGMARWVDTVIAVTVVLAMPLLVRSLRELEGLNIAWLLAGTVTAALTLTIGGAQTLWGRGGINEAYLGPAYLSGIGLVVAASAILNRSLPLWLSAASGLLCGLGLIATGSRGPVLAVVTASIALVVLRGGIDRRVFAAISAVAVALLVGARLASSASLLNLVSEDRTRPSLWNIAWEEFLANPILGGGWASYAEAAWRGGYLWITYPHNVFLEVMAEFGAIGLLALLLILGSGVSRVWRARQWTPVCTTGSIAAFWLTGQQFSYDLSNRLLWISVAACLIVPGLKTTVSSSVGGSSSRAAAHPLTA